MASMSTRGTCALPAYVPKEGCLHQSAVLDKYGINKE